MDKALVAQYSGELKERLKEIEIEREMERVRERK